jgi:hypothetical protein
VPRELRVTGSMQVEYNNLYMIDAVYMHYNTKFTNNNLVGKYITAVKQENVAYQPHLNKLLCQ